MNNSSGKIRQQAIFAASMLTFGLNLTQDDFSNKGQEQDDMFFKSKQLIDIVKFGFYAYSTEKLLEKYFQPKYKKYKYVSSLPKSEYKSLQKLISEGILRSDYYDNIFQWFLFFFEGRSQHVYSGNYSTDLKFLLDLVTDDDYSIINLIDKSWSEMKDELDKR